MARKPRELSPTNIYHVIFRSINQQQIFEEERDYQKYLYILDECREAYHFEILGYCIMGNHVHLLLHSEEYNFTNAFKSMGCRFVRWYNKKYQRTGHLFQNRFFCAPIDTESYFLSVLDYIHRNPVKANMVRYSSEYFWSSYKSYLGQKDKYVTINIQRAIDVAGSTKALLSFFSRNTTTTQLIECSEFAEEKILVPDANVNSLVYELTNCVSPSDFQRLPKWKRNINIQLLSKHGLTQNQISRYCGISRTTIYRVIKAANKE